MAIEGPNGAGKSLVADHLADFMGAAIIRYPQPFLDFRTRNQLDEAVAPLPRLVYYLAGAAHLSDDVAGAKGPIVCDRYFASPLAQMLAEGTLSSPDIFEISRPIVDRLVMPDVTVLLTAEPDTLRQRLVIRGLSRSGSSMRLTMTSARFAVLWMENLRRILDPRGPLIEIDTTNLDRAEVCDAVLDSLAAYLVE